MVWLALWMAMPLSVAAQTVVPALGATAVAPPSHDMHDMSGMSAMSPPASALPPNRHVPPPPPTHPRPALAMDQMATAMQMDDHAWRGMLLADRLERTGGGGDQGGAWDVKAWYGGDVDRLWLRSEGERAHGGTADASAELLWGHAYASFWDAQLGWREDFGDGPHRAWLAAGVQGLAPYGFALQTTFYLGQGGRTAARLELSHDLLLSQRLILAPRIELNLYGKDDPRRGVAAGLSEGAAGLRLRYEFSRRFAPYLGVEWQDRRGGETGPSTRREPTHQTRWLVGLRCWF